MAASAKRLAEAVALATQEPPGPVHLDLPEDVAAGQCEGIRWTRARQQSRCPILSSEMAQAVSDGAGESRAVHW